MHRNGYARIDGKGLDFVDTVVRRTRESEEPLSRLARRTEAIGLGRSCPYILSAPRRTETRIYRRVVIAGEHDARLPPEGERVRSEWEQRAQQSDNYREDRESHRHAHIVSPHVLFTDNLPCTLFVWIGFACTHTRSSPSPFRYLCSPARI